MGSINLNTACHEQVLAAAEDVTAGKGVNEFTPPEIVEELGRVGSKYSESSIRTDVVSAKDHHAVVFDYFERLGRADTRCGRIISTLRAKAIVLLFTHTRNILVDATGRTMTLHYRVRYGRSNSESSRVTPEPRRVYDGPLFGGAGHARWVSDD